MEPGDVFVLMAQRWLTHKHPHSITSQMIAQLKWWQIDLDISSNRKNCMIQSSGQCSINATLANLITMLRIWLNASVAQFLPWHYPSLIHIKPGFHWIPLEITICTLIVRDQVCASCYYIISRWNKSADLFLGITPPHVWNIISDRSREVSRKWRHL